VSTSILNRSVGREFAKSQPARIYSGFVARYLSGSHVLDIGFRGSDPQTVAITEQATGVDLDYPGYDGKTLPFEDNS
jgi:hypothetical protein